MRRACKQKCNNNQIVAYSHGLTFFDVNLIFHSRILQKDKLSKYDFSVIFKLHFHTDFLAEYHMNVFLLKDVTNIGTEGQVLKVKEGFARNFLLPKKLAVIATQEHVERYKELKEKVGAEVVAQGARAASIADHIKRTNIVIKQKVNEKGKLYGALNAEDVVDLLKAKNINVNKKQIEFDKAVRTPGEYTITIRLTSKLKPQFKLVVQAENKEKN